MNTSTKPVLVSHVDTDIVTRQELALIPTPSATNTFKPIAHIELIETLQSVLLARDIQIENEKLAVRRDGSALFGVIGLNYGEDVDGRAALGLRTANDKTMSIRLVAGFNVFVCDNMALRGDMIALVKKHSGRLSLREELEGAVSRFVEHFKILQAEVGYLKAKELTETQAKALMFDVFAQGIMPARFLATVAKEWLTPTHPAFEPRTAWSLHNAFTEVAKAMPITTRIPATQQIGRLFGMTANSKLEV